MKVGLAVLNTMQPILGLDLHEFVPPPYPIPWAPYLVVWGTGLSGRMMPGWAAQASKALDPGIHPNCNSVQSGLGHLCARGHDAGPHLGHLSSCVFMLPFIFPGSSSKSEFGVESVQTQHGAVAVNLLSILQFNLDCGEPIPSTTGRTYQFDQRVRAGFTFADLVAGFVHTRVDTIIDALISNALGLAGMGLDFVMKRNSQALAKQVGSLAEESLIRKGLKEITEQMKQEEVARIIASDERMKSLANIIVKASTAGVGQVIGGPTGASTPTSAYGKEFDFLGKSSSGQPQSIGSWIDNTIDDLIYSRNDTIIPSQD